VAVIAVVAALLALGHSNVRRPHGAVGSSSTTGRILYADAWGLNWLYPGHKVMRVAHGFIGAEVVAAGTQLLAWRPTQNPRAHPPCQGCFADVDYYLMNVNGSARRLVLRAEATKSHSQVGHLDVTASPNGSMLAYVRQAQALSTGNNLFDQLWVTDLSNGRKINLGPAPSSDHAFSWTTNTTLLAETPNGSALQEVNVDTGRRSTFLRVSSPRIVHAYESARPGSGAPVGIDPIGWSTDRTRSTLAVTLWGGSQRRPTRSAVALITHGMVRSFAPGNKPLDSLTWGPAGRFLIQSALATSAVRAQLFVGMVGKSKLVQVPSYGLPIQIAFGPGAAQIAEGYQNGSWVTVPTPSGVCQFGCAKSRSISRNKAGILMAWVR
jgi:hypothetical protein